MNFGRQFYSFLLLFFLSLITAYGQTLENVKASFDGEHMVISYDLNNPDANQKFKIALYSSHDNYTTPIANNTGDIGENVLPGKSKKVVWTVRNSLPSDFDKDITMKVKASKVVVVSKLALTPLSKTAFKNGQSVDVQWQGGKPTDKINIALYKDGALQQKVAENVSNNKSYTWSVPKGVKGKGYSLHISDATDQSTSQVFSIKPKLPLLYIIVPVVLVGGLVAILAGGGTETTTTESDLPGPVKP